MAVTIRPLTAADRPRWDVLYKGYADFYGVPQTPEMRDKVFVWLMSSDHTSAGLVAEDDSGTVIGLTHYRPFASPLRAIENCFLDAL